MLKRAPLFCQRARLQARSIFQKVSRSAFFFLANDRERARYFEERVNALALPFDLRSLAVRLRIFFYRIF